ncbi:glycine-rich domain-containing protein [Streptomyces sp. NPDC002078]
MATIAELEAVESIQKLDLEPIIYKMMHPEPGVDGISLEEADRRVKLYRQFLTLILLHPNKSIVPTKEIDDVWHYHILDTAKYRVDCGLIFGRFLDHFPYLGLRGEDDVTRWESAFAETKRLWREHFGATPAVESAACGNDCGGSLCDGGACDSASCNASVMQTDCNGPDAKYDGRIRPRPDRTPVVA